MTHDLNSHARQLLEQISLKESTSWNRAVIDREHEMLVKRVDDHLRQVAAEARERALREASKSLSQAAENNLSNLMAAFNLPDESADGVESLILLLSATINNMALEPPK